MQLCSISYFCYLHCFVYFIPMLHFYCTRSAWSKTAADVARDVSSALLSVLVLLLSFIFCSLIFNSLPKSFEFTTTLSHLLWDCIWTKTGGIVGSTKQSEVMYMRQSSSYTSHFMLARWAWSKEFVLGAWQNRKILLHMLITQSVKMWRVRV